MSTVLRKEPCYRCPFRSGAPKEARERGRPILMLCHESSCLDGEGTNDYVCAGWADERGLNRETDDGR